MLSKTIKQNAVRSLKGQTPLATQLTSYPQCSYKSSRLNFYDKGGRNSISGVRATVFGGTSPLGLMVGAKLTSIGSRCVYPYRNAATVYDLKYRDLKVNADLGYKFALKLNDFTDVREIELAVRESNVVINCIGSKIFYNNEKEFEDANIRVPMAIAKAVKARGDVQRFIHISSAGADPNSASRRLRTKWIGEQEVKAIYPDAIIIRPTYMFNTLHINPSIIGKWSTMMKMFNRMAFVIDGADAKFQPVHPYDVVLAIYNIIKMDESVGQTYELGGPHSYNIREMYEMFFNYTNIKPYLAPVKLEDAYDLYNTKWYTSFWRIAFRLWMAPEMLVEESVDLVTDPKAKGFQDLFIKPVSFGQKVHDYVDDIYWFNNADSYTKREDANA